MNIHTVENISTFHCLSYFITGFKPLLFFMQFSKSIFDILLMEGCPDSANWLLILNKCTDFIFCEEIIRHFCVCLYSHLLVLKHRNKAACKPFSGLRNWTFIFADHLLKFLCRAIFLPVLCKNLSSCVWKEEKSVLGWFWLWLSIHFSLHGSFTLNSEVVWAAIFQIESCKDIQAVTNNPSL